MRISRASSSAIWSPVQPSKDDPRLESEEEWPSFSPLQIQRRMESPSRSQPRESGRLIQSPQRDFKFKLKGILPPSLRSSLSINPGASYTESQLENQENLAQISPDPRTLKFNTKRSSFLVLRPIEPTPSSFSITMTCCDSLPKLPDNGNNKLLDLEGKGQEQKMEHISPTLSQMTRGTRESWKKAETRIHKLVQKRKYVRKVRSIHPPILQIHRPAIQPEGNENNESLKMIEREFTLHRKVKIVTSKSFKEKVRKSETQIYKQTHKEGEYMCQKCSKKFKTGQALGGHMSRLHKKKNEAVEKEKEYRI